MFHHQFLIDRIMKISKESSSRQSKKTLVAVCIMVPIALLHFFTGPSYKGPYPEFVNGYLLDILVPFGFYFLLCPQDVVFPFFRSWIVKAAPVLAVGIGVEIAQFYGAPIFGQTFDPWDFVMYGIGILAAIILDTKIFSKIFEFWKPKIV